jgi:hypothetical protein
MEYPERLSRLSTFFRFILIIPIVIFLGLLGAASFNGSFDNEGARDAGTGAGAIGGSILLAIWATILVKGRIPHWLFNFQVGLNRFTSRAYSYFALLTDKYPAFEGDWVLTYEVDYPDRLSRWKVLVWKLITSIPHFIVLFFLGIAAFVVIIIGWFAILFTGAFPRGLHAFVVGVLRWWARVTAYFESLTDEFPPYSLEEDAGPGSQSSYVLSAIGGGLILLAIIAGAATAAAVLFIVFNEEKSEEVSYRSLLAGDVSSSIEMDDVTFTLREASDPASADFLTSREGKRLVQFTLDFEGDFDDGDEFSFGPEGGGGRDFDRNSVRLETDDDNSIDPVFLTFEGVPAPIDFDDVASGEIVAIFEIDEDETPEELRAYPDDGTDRHVAWELRD